MGLIWGEYDRTTSMPKAACLTHRSILNNGKSIGDRMLLTNKDVICCPPPLFQYSPFLHPSLPMLTTNVEPAVLVAS